MNKLSWIACLVASLIVGSFLAGCAARTSTFASAQFTQYRPPEAAPFGPTEKEFAENNCPFGMPSKAAAWDHGTTEYIAREGYVLEFSSINKVPIWVCERVTPDQLLGDAKRKNVFQPDELLDGPRSELSDYRGSGFDRGHQAPAGNQNRSQELKNETFYLSNMAPQLGGFNQRVWAELEDLSRSWVEDRGDLHIITGGFLYDPKEENSNTADGLIPHEAIGEGQVTVPTHFYKIVVSKNANGHADAIAFVLENKTHPQPYQFSGFIKSIDWIEERTGLDFMPELGDIEEDAIESQTASMW